MAIPYGNRGTDAGLSCSSQGKAIWVRKSAAAFEAKNIGRSIVATSEKRAATLDCHEGTNIGAKPGIGDRFQNKNALTASAWVLNTSNLESSRTVANRHIYRRPTAYDTEDA